MAGAKSMIAVVNKKECSKMDNCMDMASIVRTTSTALVNSQMVISSNPTTPKRGAVLAI